MVGYSKSYQKNLDPKKGINFFEVQRPRIPPSIYNTPSSVCKEVSGQYQPLEDTVEISAQQHRIKLEHLCFIKQEYQPTISVL